MPKFSIIIPVYNVASYLRECLDSVLAQSFPDWEAICVDDGSIDDSGAILDGYAAKDGRFRVMHQKNAGVSVARNAALDIARGEWVFFLDGDDVMAPGALEILARISITASTDSLIRFGLKMFEDCAEWMSLGAVTPDSVRRIDISKKINIVDFSDYVVQFLFKRSLIENMEFKRYKRGEDRIFLVSVLCSKVNAFLVTNSICYFYRQRLGSATHAFPSVQVLQDELSHRIDILETIDRSGKRVSYAGSGWEHYFTHRFFEIVNTSNGYSNEERIALEHWFDFLLPRLRCVKGFSFVGKLVLFSYRMSGSSNWRKAVAWMAGTSLGGFLSHPFVSIRKRVFAQ